MTSGPPTPMTATEVRAALALCFTDPQRVIRECEAITNRSALDTLRWGVALGQSSRLDTAAAVLRQTVLTARDESATGVELVALAEVGKAHARMGDHGEALSLFNEALGLARRVGERRLEAVVLGNIGMLHGTQDRPEPYAAYTRQALEIARELQDDQLLAINKINLAGALTRLGRLEESEILYDRAEAAMTRLDWPYGRALLLAGRGAVFGERGDIAQSERLTLAANDVLAISGNAHQMALHLNLLGHRALRHRALEVALRSFSAALALATDRGIDALVADANDGLQQTYEAVGDIPAALAAARAVSEARAAQHRQQLSERTRVLTYAHELEAARKDTEAARARAAELEHANAALVEAREELVRSLAEREALLLEVHHRVKNNLQVISSLLRLQAEQLEAGAARNALETCVTRVRSMALVHQQIYGLDSLTHVDLAQYTRELTESLRASIAPCARVRVETQPEVVTVPAALAVPLGLVLNELVTSALRHGVPSLGDGRFAGPGCDVRVEVAHCDETVRVTVADGGGESPGGGGALPELSHQILRALARQLRGTLELEGGQGTRVTLTCPA